MRRYLFTDLERGLLESWLLGKQTSENPVALDKVLDRIRINKRRILGDTILFIHALRKLKVERRFER